MEFVAVTLELKTMEFVAVTLALKKDESKVQKKKKEICCTFIK